MKKAIAVLFAAVVVLVFGSSVCFARIADPVDELNTGTQVEIISRIQDELIIQKGMSQNVEDYAAVMKMSYNPDSAPVVALEFYGKLVGEGVDDKSDKIDILTINFQNANYTKVNGSACSKYASNVFFCSVVVETVFYGDKFKFTFDDGLGLKASPQMTFGDLIKSGKKDIDGDKVPDAFDTVDNRQPKPEPEDEGDDDDDDVTNPTAAGDDAKLQEDNVVDAPTIANWGELTDKTQEDKTDQTSTFDSDDGGCSVVTGVSPNPIIFILLAAALIPLSLRRRV